MSKDVSWLALQQQLDDRRAAVSAAELHGHLCGRLVGGHVVTGPAGERILQELVLPDQQQTLQPNEFLDLMEQTEQQLESSLFGFELLLPDDEASLPQRLEGLADWCNGLLSGLGSTLAVGEMNSSTEVREILQDLVEIGNLSLDAEDSNENEAHFAELEEYVRVAVMNLYTLFRTAAMDEAEDSGREPH